MAEKILMPKLSDTMEEGVIASWLVKVGDQVAPGDVLAEIETDKATMEFEAYEEGTVLYLAEAGSTVAVDALIAIIGQPGESFEALLTDGPLAPASKAPASEVSTIPSPAPTEKMTAPAQAQATLSGKAIAITMPKLSDTMEEGVIAEWHKKVGDKVAPGDLLAEIETDKATMEFEAYDEGTLLHIAAQKGESVAVDALLCIIGEPGASYEALLGGATSLPPQAPSNPNPEPKPSPEPGPSPINSGNENGRVKASPLARKMAQEKGYNLAQIKGTGDFGRIVKKDVEAFQPNTMPPAENPTPAPIEKTIEKASPAPAPAYGIGQEAFENKKVSQMRKTIARRLSESKFTAPHFYLTIEINMEEAMATRKKLNELSPVKISFNDMIVKAAAVALRQHPQVNASWQGDTLRYAHHVHVGVAVAVEEGLLVPVIRFADAKSLSQIATETKELAQKAKEKKLQPHEWEGNTFSISNLGMFGIEEFTAIINPPDACIMAVGAIKETAIVKDGALVPGSVMKVTLSCDHRVVDGASGAQFLQTFKQLMEAPIRMLV
ncbi:MAG: pyruvate dehydrogenase complex dihydrolipoamide acetyltransferase [Microscillaceae bacterium]